MQNCLCSLFLFKRLHHDIMTESIVNLLHTEVYDTFEEINELLNANARRNDYALIIDRFKKNSLTQKNKKYWIICDRVIIYKKKFNKRIKNTIIVKCDCQWSIIVIYHKKNEKWHVTIENNDHNHESTKFVAQVSHRRKKLNDEMFKMIDNATKENQCCQFVSLITLTRNRANINSNT